MYILKQRIVTINTNVMKKNIYTYAFVSIITIISNQLYAQSESSMAELQKEATNNNVDAQYELGTAYYKGSDSIKPNLENAFYWLKKAAENNNSSAQSALSVMYENGEGTVKNSGKSMYWYLKAAGQQDYNVEYSLGVLFENKTYIDLKQSRYWYLKAANHEGINTVAAKSALTRIYTNGIGTPIDLVNANYWLNKAKNTL